MKIIRPAPIGTTALVASSVADTPAAYNAGTTYALVARVQDPVTHREYESVQGANTGHPLYDSAWWLDVGPVNRWRMFDQTNGTRTESANALQVDLMIGGRVNAVALLNTEAATAQIIGEVNGAEVYNRSFPMTADSGISDWFDWFFEPIIRKPDLIVTDVPTYSNMALSVIVSRPGGTVKVGTLVVGQVKELGFTLAGMSTGIIDFSRKSADDFGNYVLVERAFSKKLDARVVVENTEVDDVVAALSELRATPVVWLAKEGSAAAGLFGFYRNFSVTFEYPEQSICLLELEGLT